CGRSAVGTYRDVARRLGVRALRKAKLTGKNVRVAVVDTGIDGSQVPVVGGWSPNPGYQPGTTPPDHGTMVGFDVRIAAPDARILDYALLQSTGQTWTAFLSDAIAAFANLIDLLQSEPGPLVVNNSWGMFDRSEDAAIGSPENYAVNPDHPFNQIVGSLVDTGADVCFAAGNCGAQCPDGPCGPADVGPGASIHGANSHPDVITVAAVTVTNRRLGYSSQGPGALYKRKPDVAGYSHFKGSGVYPAADEGTSAASPVVAGVAAALRQKLKPNNLPPASLKGVLQRTARDLQGDGWDYDLGYGVANAAAAVKALGLT
ncbi:MAG: S8 family serine peptidase, partial [Acidobacteria bacterium]|nr:S8 family serine peptidase [Acidobacteriota bacterium]